MKRRIVALFTVLSLLSLSACSGDENVFPDVSGNNTGVTAPADLGESVTVFDYDMSQYVEVGDYRSLTIDYEPYDLTEEDIDYAYMTFLNDYANMVDPANYVTDREVHDGDTVSLNYCGTKDGVAFEGGTAEGYLLKIGSGTFIPGFEEGLIGVMPGEEIDLPLTFPEEYHAEDLAGQEVIFTCTVNGIITIDSILATANDNRDEGTDPIETEEDLREMCREELVKQVKAYDRENVQSLITQNLSTIVTEKAAFPQELVDAYDALVLKSVESSAAMYGIDSETLLSYYGYTLDSYIAEFSRPQLVNDAALYVIASENNLLQTDEEFEASLQEYADSYGVTIDELLTQLTREEYRVYFLEEDTLNFLTDLYTID
ncbi:MAG: FKBP-type peptidyl-prolyl cis-trans isomerase [Lachnospiraceae bacterium]|nr:FKBP-type peptidyl-prolyl cis-trans isomerase [Lachnospiraceae bacterium]